MIRNLLRSLTGAPSATTSRALLLEAPWATDHVATRTGASVPVRGRLLTSSEIKAVHVRGTGDSLPLVAEGVVTPWGQGHLWEIPSTGTRREIDGLVTEHVVFDLRSSEAPEPPCRFELRGLPGRSRDARAEESDPAQAWQVAMEFTEGVVDRHVEMISELREAEPLSDSSSWRRSGSRLAIRDLAGLLDHWIASDRGDEPRHALIVRLAKELRVLLPDVCHRPRVVLSRQREMQPVDRIQQVDNACLRWLARQPGVTVAEKAGARQQVLGVVRNEHADTHENRVVKDLLARGIRAGELYLREYRHFGSHARVELVRAFVRTLRSLQKESSMVGVRPLVGAPRDNYVLQHDSRYSVLWRAYVQLLRQETAMDSVWRWRHRLWSETSLLAALSALRDVCEPGFANRSDIVFHGEHSCGHFLDAASQVSSLVHDDLRIEVLLGALQVTRYGNLGLPSKWAPDLTLVVRRRSTNSLERVIALWGLLHFGLEGGMKDALAGLQAAWPKDVRIASVLVLPEGAASGLWHQRGLPSGVCLVGLPFPPQKGVSRLAEVLLRVLERRGDS